MQLHSCTQLKQAPLRSATTRSVRRLIVASTSFQGCDQPLPKKVKVVGVGGCVVDYLASISEFPRPDEKLRTEKLEVQGGGNCANAMTAAARLGLSPCIVTKIGDDGLGDGIISELQRDGIDTKCVLRAPNSPSPFTYIIVDRSGGTRTCIHTPGANLIPEDLSTSQLDEVLADAALVYFDGRLTEAAIKVAQHARSKDISVLVEGERLRPNLELLLAEADYVVTSAHFPQDWTGEAELADALLGLAHRLPKARFIITTMGTRGSVMLERADAHSSSGSSEGTGSVAERSLADVMADLQSQLKQQQQQEAAGQDVPDCISSNGTQIRAGVVTETPGYVKLTYSSAQDSNAAAEKVKAAAARAAALNADSSKASGYAMATAEDGTAAILGKVTVASIASLPQGAVVDTTGAGDSFIGSIVYGLATGMSRPRMLQLAAVVAACKCTAMGARPGLPHRSNLSPKML